MLYHSSDTFQEYQPWSQDWTIYLCYLWTDFEKATKKSISPNKASYLSLKQGYIEFAAAVKGMEMIVYTIELKLAMWKMEPPMVFIMKGWSVSTSGWSPSIIDVQIISNMIDNI